jgi:DNA-binding SARP family transcriptional activator
MACKRATAPVKLTRPRLFDVVLRPRLFATLDRLLRHPVVWITGPPGAGKTTLIASYLESRKLPCLWYQVDAADADPATFFHYLALGLAEHSRGRAALPLFQDVCLQNVATFSRRFFRALFAQLRTSSVLAFDNVEDVSDSPKLVGVLRAASDEVPQHSNLVLSSRCDPPAAFAYLSLNQRMATLDPASLRLTLDEAREVAAAAGLHDDNTVCALYERTDGWTAGLRLLTEQARRGASLTAPEDAHSNQALFDFFAQQVIATALPGAEHLLLRLAVLPRMTVAIAREVSGSEHCGKVLDDLARRHLFVERHAGSIASRPDTDRAPVYQFHKLFRAFLREHALRTLEPDALRQFARRGARALEAERWVEDALELYLEAHEWEEAVRLMREVVPHLLHQSRSGQVQRWLALLPEERREADPWLLYWSGCACAGQDPAGARAFLERAHLRAQERSLHALSAQCVAVIVETIFLEYTHFAPLDRWIAVLETALEHPTDLASLDHELRAHSALLSAVLYRRGDAPVLAAIAARTRDLLYEDVDADLKLAAGAWLLSYSGNLGKLELAADVLPVVEPLLDRADLSPLRRGLCAYFVAWCAVMRTDRTAATRALDRLQRMAQEFQAPMHDRFVIIITWWWDVVWRPHPDLARLTHDMEAKVEASHPYEFASLQFMRAWTRVAAGEAADGLQAALAAVSAYEVVGSPWHRLLARGIALWASVELGDHRRGQSLMLEMRHLAASSNISVYDAVIHQAQAWLALQAGDEPRLERQLRALFTQAQAYGTGMPTRFIRAWMPGLAAQALRRDIETAYVRRLISTYAWTPPEPDVEGWPYAIRVRMLGRYELEVDGKPLSFEGKAPRKTLSLLKALVCFGGQDVRDYQLIDALWPDEEADAARTVFNVTLHRLRRLLHWSDAIELSEGSVSLNLDRVWVDAITFEQLLATSGPVGVPEDEAVARAIALYAGPLLPGDLDASWSVAARERLRMKFVHHVVRLGRALEERGSWDDAIALYTRGLDADSLNESFYCGIMRAHHLAGRDAEAMSLYARFRKALSGAFGIEPSPESRALYERIAPSAAGTREISGSAHFPVRKR